MATNAEHRSKFAALHRQWWRLQISENLEWGEKINKQTKPPVHLDNDCLMYMTNLLLLLAHCLITDSHISDNIIWTQSKEINGLWPISYVFVAQSFCSITLILNTVMQYYTERQSKFHTILKSQWWLVHFNKGRTVLFNIINDQSIF